MFFIRTNVGIRYYSDMVTYVWTIDAINSFGPDVEILNCGSVG